MVLSKNQARLYGLSKTKNSSKFVKSTVASTVPPKKLTNKKMDHIAQPAQKWTARAKVSERERGEGGGLNESGRAKRASACQGRKRNRPQLLGVACDKGLE
jgi:hypothetical protein